MTASLESFARRALAPAGIEHSISRETDNSAYSAAVLSIGDTHLRFRQGRVTPTKPGAFVSVWRRAADGGTEPFPAADACDGLLVSVQDGHREGLFYFTRAHLKELGVTRSKGKPGKRGFRVYPPWCHELNPQASRSQLAQAPAFVDLSGESSEAGFTDLLRRMDLA